MKTALAKPIRGRVCMSILGLSVVTLLAFFPAYLSAEACQRSGEVLQHSVATQVASAKEQTALLSLLHMVYQRRTDLLLQLVEHIQLTLFAMVLAVTVGVTTGIVLTWFRRLAGPVLGVASVIQTVPSLALLALMIPLLGIGQLPAIAALFLYALLPILRNTYTAVDEVDPAVIEVGRGMGMTKWQILCKVQIPLCVPMVMAGIRTSTVICVGIATLCTFIGAGGLGDMIMEGMQTRGSALIFAGVVPAILLALGLDGLMALSQWLLTPQGLRVSQSKMLQTTGVTKKILGTIVVLILVVAVTAAIMLYRPADIVVGSKHFTEQRILGEMVAQLIETHTGLKVRRRLGLQGTKVCFAAIREGELDIYPEYTGTGLVNILEEQYSPSKSPRDILQYVRDKFYNQWRLIWFEPLGFDNTYAFAMRAKHAEELGVERVSDLVQYKDQLRLGFDHEYTTRPEFKQFERVYGFSFGRQIARLDPDLTYKALADGSVDLIDAFSTDGRIAAYDLRILEDDKNLFPPYDACIVVRQDTLNRYEAEGLREALERLSGAISVEQMRQMNYAVTEDLRSPASVAAEFLSSWPGFGRLRPDERPSGRSLPEHGSDSP